MPAVIDADGACLVCGIEYRIAELAREIARRPTGLRQIGWMDRSASDFEVIPASVNVTDSALWRPVYVIDDASSHPSPSDAIPTDQSRPIRPDRTLTGDTEEAQD